MRKTAIRERLAEITQGKWFHEYDWSLTVDSKKGRICDFPDRDSEQCNANARFIAHAPADIAALIAEVEQMHIVFHAELMRLAERMDHMRDEKDNPIRFAAVTEMIIEIHQAAKKYAPAEPGKGDQ